MLKQTLIAGAAVLLFAAPAFAHTADVSVDNSGAVMVQTETDANTGANVVSADGHGTVEDVTVTTGAAVASSTVGTELNNNTVTVNLTGMKANVDLSNSGCVAVDALTTSNSGANVVSAEDWHSKVGDSSVTTGASTAGSNDQTLVNVNSVSVTTNNGLSL
ncbi:MAG: hypothetical protein KGJ07_05445 [Patescibacteria group bacterium]|nr:hypothetical protein [Patescibacteria group bacterium]MDE2589262.1 hypothetical protein [Patescibacteria group bacterium]